MSEYTPKAVVNKITATSRASMKIRDNFFTVEYAEERIVPDLEGVDIEMERIALWDAVNAECDRQMAIIAKTYGAVRKSG